MNHDVMITCAVTGDDTKVTKSPHCAITPEQIANTAIEAAQAGAAIVHIHVRDPETGGFSMETKYYREVVKRIRESKTDVIVNLTCGMGGYICVGDHGLSDTPAPGSDFCSQEDRMRHVIDLCQEGLYRPDIATLDCGSLNFGDTNRAYVSTPNYLRRGAEILRELRVKPELEIFDTGNLWFVKQMIKEELIPAPALVQLCMGIPWGVPADTGHLLAMVNSLPPGSEFTSFGISRMQMPWVAQSVLLGGHVRVGLEDNLYLSRGVYASNAQLVERARTIIEAMGARVLSPAQARERLKIG
ncbi:MAG TPA: 3-keto-5-aminohexanoate cleavage protein [Steroidobacteraceae bacterium]|nr:3-keto-5-aminohexanoate cleavage protein [Steroidobacteraceae bacterium]